MMSGTERMIVRTDHFGALLRRGLLARTSVVVHGLCLLGVAAMWPTFAALGRLWGQSHDYGHGYLIAAVSIVWLAMERRRLDALAARPFPAAVPVLLFALGVWAVAYRANSEIAQQLLTPAILVLAVLAAAGRQVAARVIVPLAYLYFAVPVWNQLLPLLQMFTASVAEGVLRLVNVPASLEGHVVTIPEGQFSIVEGCSGLRYLLVALAFAALVAVQQRLRRTHAALLIAAAVTLALLVNWLRVIVIIYAGHVSNMQHYLVAREHLTFGTLMFVPLIVAIIVAAQRLGRGVAAAPSPAAPPALPACRATAWLPAAACLCIPAFVVATQPEAMHAATRLGSLPLSVGAWQGPLPPDPVWQPYFTSPADELRAAYASPQGEVQVYVNVYGAQSQGHELIFFTHSAAPSGHWTIQSKLQHYDDLAMVVARNSVQDRWVIAWTYSIQGRLTAAPVLAQMSYGLRSLWRPVPAGAIALAAPCQVDCAGAAGQIERFWSDKGRTLASLIPGNL